MGNFGRDGGRRDDRRGGFGGPRRSFGNDRGFGGRGGGFGRGPREMFKATCANCGKECEVPFRPSGDKPVYCSDCFEKMGNRGERRSYDRPQSAPSAPAQNFKADFDALNAKLDRIIAFLEPKKEVVKPTENSKVEVVAEVSSEEKPKKAAKKKVSKAVTSEE